MKSLLSGIQSITLFLFILVLLMQGGGINFLYADQYYYFGLLLYPLLLLFSGVLLIQLSTKIFVHMYSYYHRAHIVFHEDNIFIIGLITGLTFSLLYIAKISGGF